MYDLEKRDELTDNDYQELLRITLKVENFIREVEKGTKREGEFDKRFIEILK